MNYNKNSKKSAVVTCVAVVLILIVTVTVIVVSVIRSKDDKQSLEPTTETTDPNKVETDEPGTDIPAIETKPSRDGESTDETQEQTDDGNVEVDILDINREISKDNNPHIIGEPSVISGVKEAEDDVQN